MSAGSKARRDGERRARKQRQAKLEESRLERAFLEAKDPTRYLLNEQLKSIERGRGGGFRR